MENIELRQQRAKLVEEAKEILRRAEEENRDLLGDEEARWQEAMTDAEKLKARIDRIETLKGVESDLEDIADEVRSERRIVTPTEFTAEDEMRAFDSYIRRGKEGLDAEERSILTRAQSTTDSEGGYTVPEGFAGYVTEAMLAFGGMRQSRATVISTDSGNDLPFPTNDDTSNTGAILGENTQVSEQDLTFGEVVLGAFKYTSKLVRVSEELLQDSAVNMPAFLGRKLGERLGRITNEHLSTGDGASKPRGLFTALGTGVTAASATAFTADELIELQYSVDPAYQANAEWMMNFDTEFAVRKLKDGNGNYLWVAGLQNGAPDRILGKPVVRNQDAPADTTGLDPIAYGDFSYYIIREVRGIQLKTFIERYGDYLQRGYLAWGRWDGDWIDAGGGAAKVLMMA